MSNMINELRVVEHDMTNEQQVKAVIHSLPSHLEHMCVNLTDVIYLQVHKIVTK